jgi:hypothetical protein
MALLQSLLGPDVCFSGDKVLEDDLVNAILHYGATHPKEVEGSIGDLIGHAFSERWPCPQKK